MRLVLASRAPSPHDQRFADAWRSVGVEVSLLHTVGIDAEELREHIISAKPDVIQAGPLSDVAPLVCEAWDGPLIAVSWGFDLMDEARNPVIRERIANVLATADQVLVDNSAALRVALGMGAAAGRTTQMPWGVELDRFHPGKSSLRTTLGWTANEFVLLSTRRQEQLYDVETTALGFALAATDLPQLRGLFCGSGSRNLAIRELLAANGVLERCVFLGDQPTDALADIYRAADVYVSSSHVDGTSVSLLEAMATGIPVCVSEIEGNAQWIAGGRGASFAVGAAAELAERVVWLVNHPGGAALMARSALGFVREHADWSKAGRRLMAIATAAMDGKGK